MFYLFFFFLRIAMEYEWEYYANYSTIILLVTSMLLQSPFFCISY